VTDPPGLASFRVIQNPAAHVAVIDQHSVHVDIVSHLEAVERALSIVCSGFPSYPEGPVGHWIERRWRDALQYHLSSLDICYDDEQDESGAIREEVLRQYYTTDLFPRRFVTFSGGIPLSPPIYKSQKLLAELLLNRRTTRSFKGSEIDETTLSSILWDAFKNVRECRLISASPDRDALYSFGVAFDFYLAVHRCDLIVPGLYYYHLTDHSLVSLTQGTFSIQLSECMQGQGDVANSCFTLLFVTDWKQYLWRYRHERALRNLFIESGRIAQRLVLVSENHSLGVFLTPALSDRRLSDLLSLDPVFQYPLVTVGTK
jgi:SagB-type dehydrogenase family enzyme